MQRRFSACLIVVVVLTLVAPGALPVGAGRPAAPLVPHRLRIPLWLYNAVSPLQPERPGMLPGGGWWTGAQVMNVSSVTATITMTVGVNFIVRIVGPGESTTFLAGDVGGPGFQGSAVVDSDQSIVGIVTLTNRQSGSYGVPGGVAGAQYQAIDDDATAMAVKFPIAKNAYGSGTNIKTTQFFVQNAGSAATTVTATYTGCGAHTNTSPSINPGEMVVMNPSAAGVPAGSLCSATMSASQPIAGAAAEYYNSETVGTLAQATRGYSSADYGTMLYAPIFKKRFPTNATRSRTTGAQIQNVSAGAIDVTGTFRGSGACAGPYVLTITGVASGGYANFLYPATTPPMPDGCLTSATFVGTGDIVGIVNESYLDPPPPPGTQSSSSYNLLPAVSATTRAVAPLFKYLYGGKTSGLQVQNVGTVTATVYIEFRSGGNVYTTTNYIVPPGSPITVAGDCCWVGTPMPPGTNASAKVFSDQPIISLLAEMPYTVLNPSCFGQANGPCYDRMNYEGFNVNP
jgi:hypothetical protein